MDSTLNNGFDTTEPHSHETSLVNLVISSESVEEIKQNSVNLPSLIVSDRTVCDLELLSVGAFSPLDGFMGSEDYGSVLEQMRLSNGNFFPQPVTLPADTGGDIALDEDIALRNGKNELLAVMTINEIFERNLEQESFEMFGTSDLRHPHVAQTQKLGDINISGKLQVLSPPKHQDFKNLRMTPIETRGKLARFEKPNVISFQTSNFLHRPDEEFIKSVLADINGVLLLQSVVGITNPGDSRHYTLIRAHQTLLEHYFDKSQVLLNVIPLAMRFKSARNALLRVLVSKNYGGTHTIIESNYGLLNSPDLNNESVEALEKITDEIGVQIINFREMVYLPEQARYQESSSVPKEALTALISRNQEREKYLDRGLKLPDWFTRPEVGQILLDGHSAKHSQGVCIWFTGLSGSGKSTTAEVLTDLLIQHGRRVTLLDGDVVRTHLSKGLGFSKKDRDTNILRIGFVATEIVWHGGFAICAAVSPYRKTRAEVKEMVGAKNFVEIFMDTPLSTCEDRDTKGLYAAARHGKIDGFTGIDDPYETPENPDILLDTNKHTSNYNAQIIFDYLIDRGFLLKKDDGI